MKRLIFALIAMTLLGSLGGCNSGESSGTSGVSGENESGPGSTKIRLALNWFPEPEHGGYYAALLGGDFAAEGLDVEIIPGGPETPVIPRLVRGQIEFGIDSADKVLIQREQDADLVTLFAPLQTSPRCIMTHASSGIDSFDKLQNVTLSVGVGQSFVKYMQKKLPLTDVQLVPYSGRIALFLSDPKQAQQGFSFSEPIFARSRGVEVNVLMVSELGFNPYSSCVIVDRTYLDQHRDVALKFVRACRRGWERYLSDPTLVNAKLAELNPELELETLAQSVDALRPLCQVAEGESFGSMTAERWSSLRDRLAEIEMIPADADQTVAYQNLPDSP